MAEAGMLALALLVIVGISGYTARLNKRSFAKELGLMMVFSLGVSIITFAIGQVLKSIIQ
ncbi:MAG: hypothetical protein Q8R08_04855 [bacterium]|nr:hypothetical protein [bacterium]